MAILSGLLERNWPVWLVLFVVLAWQGPKWIQSINECVKDHRKLNAKFESDRQKRANALNARLEKEARKASISGKPQQNATKKRSK